MSVRTFSVTSLFIACGSMGFSIFAAAAFVEEVSCLGAFVVLFGDFEGTFAFEAGLDAVFALEAGFAFVAVVLEAFFTAGVAAFLAGADFFTVLGAAAFFAGVVFFTALAAGAFLALGAAFFETVVFLEVDFALLWAGAFFEAGVAFLLAEAVVLLEGIVFESEVS